MAALARNRREWPAILLGSLPQPAENFNSPPQRLFAGRVGDAEVCVAGAEDVARDDEKLVFDRAGDELAAGCATGVASAVGRHLREDVERAAWARDLIASLEEAIDDEI